MTEDNASVRLRRTMLLTPGNQPERLAKATTLDVDSLVFDLEDGVAPDDKPAARAIINEQLRSLHFPHQEKLVRINAVGTPDYEADMRELHLGQVDGVFVPKVETPDQLALLDDALSAYEMANGLTHKIDVVATIETPRGLLNALAIADASERTSAMFFGSGDYSAATGAAVTADALAFPRATIIAAAAAAGLQAIDAAYFKAVKDADATFDDARHARELGFDGKIIFHPNQVRPCNEAFSPTEAELARARRIVKAYEQSRGEGKGTAFVDGEFIAVDIALMAERIIMRAEKIDARNKSAVADT